MNLPFPEEQTHLLDSIALLRNELLDPIFLFLNYFDTEYFVMVLIPIIWIGVSPKWGLRISCLLVVNALTNNQLKCLFDLPRPIIASPDLPMLPFRDPGFPSGAAQTATLLSGLLIYVWKSRWAWVIAIPYASLLCFSRLYLGVHYPLDIVGGISIGLILLFLYIVSIKPIEKFVKKSPGCSILIPVLFSVLHPLFLPSSKVSRLMGALLGFVLGAYAASFLALFSTRRRSIWKRTFHVIFTITTLFIFSFLLPKAMPPFLRSLILSLWISVGASLFCSAIFGE